MLIADSIQIATNIVTIISTVIIAIASLFQIYVTLHDWSLSAILKKPKKN